MTDALEKLAFAFAKACREETGGGWEPSIAQSMTIAETALAALPGMVPELEFEQLGERLFRAPAPLFGSIRVETYNGRKWYVLWSVPGYCDTLAPGEFNTPEAAKAAANAHHRAALMEAFGITQSE